MITNISDNSNTIRVCSLCKHPKHNFVFNECRYSFGVSLFKQCGHRVCIA